MIAERRITVVVMIMIATLVVYLSLSGSILCAIASSAADNVNARSEPEPSTVPPARRHQHPLRDGQQNVARKGRVLVLPMLNSSHTLMLSAVASELAHRAHHVAVLWPRESTCAAVTRNPALQKIEFSIGDLHPTQDVGENIFLMEQEAVGDTLITYFIISILPCY